MRRHAKASPAGSTQRQAKSLGHIFRGAFATWGASLASKGSGAPAAKRLIPPAGVLAALVSLAVLAIPAGASETHTFKETFGSAAQPTFGNAQGIAVDQSSGDVLVMDAGTSTISRYNSDGTPANFSVLGTNVIDGQGAGDETPQGGLGFSPPSESQIAVDNSGSATDGDIYVTQGSPNVVNIFSKDGEYLGQLTAAGVSSFAEACGVAVDPAGAVYVGDYSSGVHKFVPSANPPVNADNTATFNSVSNPCTLAAGAGASAGFIFPITYFGSVYKVDSGTGQLKYAVAGGINTTASVDPSTGHVYAMAANAMAGDAIEELDASGAGSATSVSSFSLASAGQGVAVRGSTGNVYLTRSGASNAEVFGPPVTIPDVTTGAASSLDKTTATLNGTVNPDGVALSECTFEYGTSESYGQTIPCAESTGAIGSGTSPVPVHADVSGLTEGTEYHFRLLAENANGTVNGADNTFVTLAPPSVVAEWAEGVVPTEATLKAEVNPNGFATTYEVEYGTTPAYGTSTAPHNVGSDKADHLLTSFLAGLQPGTEYHYRFVATSVIGDTNGPDHAFTTYEPLSLQTNCPNQQLRSGPSATLPNCRAYEMVSPVDKKGGDIATGTGGLGHLDQSSTTGQKFTYSSYRAFGDAVSAPYVSQYMASRSAGGWANEAIAPTRGGGVDTAFPFLSSEFKYFSPDLSTAWIWHNSTQPLTPDSIPGLINLLKRDNIGGGYEALTTVQPQVSDSSGFLPEFLGTSSDGSHAIFRSEGRLTPGAPTLLQSEKSLYEWFDGELRLVAVLPNDEPAPGQSGAGTINSSLTYGNWQSVDHAISDDGSRIFWSTFDGKIFVRINGQTTVPVSESVSTQNALFWTAGADGSKAIFTTNQTIAGDPKDYVSDLYEFDVDSETPTLIAHKVSGLFGASDDASYIYLVSREALDAGATAGEPNAYLYHAGVFSYIGTLPDTQELVPVFNGIEANPYPLSAVPLAHTARVSPDGRHLAFVSLGSLTGYDNTDIASGKAAAEVYYYDADSEELSCPSCNPSGARPVAGLTLLGDGSGQEKKYLTAASIPAWSSELYDGRVLSDDGSRLFFNAYDALVPQDTNGTQDVYQWEAEGTGECQKSGGCVSLISTGKGAENSEFVDASPSGDDVFIRTQSSIDPRDPGLVDIYDARVNGGFPYVPPTEPCVGDACQSAPEAPNDATPASAGFRGAGDPTPRKAHRRNCRARSRHAKGKKRQAKSKTKRCTRNNRRAGR